MTSRMRTVCAVAAVFAVASATPSLAQSQRLNGLQLSGNQPIQIESDKLEVRENDKIAVFTGNVKASQGTTLLKAGKMEVHYAGAGSATTGSADIERIEVSGKVYVKSDKQVATGDSASFDMRSEVLVVSGKQVVLSEGDNVAVGCKLTVQMKSGKALLDGCGRVKLQLNPKTADR